MNNSSSWAAYKAWRRSPPVHAFLVLICGLGIGRSTHSVGAGLLGGLAMVGALLIGMKLEARRRMRRERREHNARLSQW